MALPFMLLAARAAGIGINMYAQNRAEKFTRIGEELDKQQLQTRMQEEELAFNQQSVFDLQKLREVMATQRAIFSARGTNPGAGSAKAIETKSINAFGADERARKLSQTFRKNQFESQMRLYNVERASRKAKRSTQNLMNAVNMFSFNSFGENPFAGNK